MSQFFINLDKDFLERFDMARFMEETDNLDPLTSAFQNQLRDLPLFGRFTVQGEESRPDLISDKIYGTTQLWWIILMYNNIFEVNEITNGLQLTYPSHDSIDDLFFKLKAQETVAG